MNDYTTIRSSDGVTYGFDSYVVLVSPTIWIIRY